jgi:hypothetical protein
MPETKEIPTANEVRTQLNRMLASPYFNDAETQSNLLRFVVESALAEKPISEFDLKIALGGVFDVDSHKERASAHVVRLKIKKYYDNEGANDLVEIYLPPGPSYKPDIFYRFQSEAIAIYRRSLMWMRAATRGSLFEADSEIRKVRNLEPNFVPAYLADAEIALLRIVVEQTLSLVKGYRASLHHARWPASRALEIEPKSCKANILIAAECFLDFQWADAEERFAEARRIDERETDSSMWYATFLMMGGEQSKGLHIAKSLAEQYPESFWINLILSLFYYVLRDFDTALKTMFEDHASEEREVFYQLLYGLIWMAKGHFELALMTFRKVSQVGYKEWEMADFFKRVDLPEYFEIKDIKSELYLGLVVLALVGAGKQELAAKKMAVLKRHYPKDAMQSAIGYMATGNKPRALASLRRARRDGDVFVNGLHLLPLFDPLSDHPRFVQLLREISNREEDENSE